MYLTGKTLVKKNGGGKDIDEARLVHMVPEYLSNEIYECRPTLCLKDVQTMVAEGKTKEYVSRDMTLNPRTLNQAELDEIYEWLKAAWAKDEKKLGKEVTSAKFDLQGQASDNHADNMHMHLQTQQKLDEILATGTAKQKRAKARQLCADAEAAELKQKRQEIREACSFCGEEIEGHLISGGTTLESMEKKKDLNLLLKTIKGTEKYKQAKAVEAAKKPAKKRRTQ